jgi:hypothetical protein
MAIDKLKELVRSDAANHKTLLVRRSSTGFRTTLVRGDGTYEREQEHSAQQLADHVANLIKSSASQNTGSFVFSIDLVAQGTVSGPHGPGPGPGGDDWLPVLQAGVIEVEMQLRGLAEKLDLAQVAQVKRAGG